MEIIYIILWILTGVIILMGTVYYRDIVGWFGEHWIKKILKKLPKDKYYIFNDLFIKVNDNTHQIDHVIVSPYGIFSIETKQYNGYITGNKYDKKWIRHTKKKDYYYQNPIRQNYGHVKTLSQLLNIDESKIYNIVCIPSNAKLKVDHDGELTRNYNLMEKLLSYKEVVIDDTTSVIDKIKNSIIKDKSIRKMHYENIKNNIVNENECPKCGAKLIEKTGKYGNFIGCSNYPKCRFIKKD